MSLKRIDTLLQTWVSRLINVPFGPFDPWPTLVLSFCDLNIMIIDEDSDISDEIIHDIMFDKSSYLAYIQTNKNRYDNMILKEYEYFTLKNENSIHICGTIMPSYNSSFKKELKFSGILE